MADAYSATPEVVVGGAPLNPSVRAALARVEVDETLGLPTVARITLRDGGRDVWDVAGLRVGAPLQVRAGLLGEVPTEVVADGEVVSVDASYSDAGNFVVVVAYDLSHRLHRFRRTRSYHEVSLGDVVRTVAEGAGLDVGSLDDPGVVHAHLTQLNLTDWEFLTARAREAGRLVRMHERRLELVTRGQAAAAPEPGRLASREADQLVLGRNVESLRARVSSAELPATVEVRGWSAGRKEGVVATAAVSAPNTEIGVTPQELAQVAGSPVLTCADRPVDDQEEADVLAASLAEAVGGGFASATAVCRGDTRLRAGTPVSLGLAGSLFSGRWTVAAARHTFDTEGYRTTVELGGAGRAGVLTSMAQEDRRRGASSSSLDGVVSGVVTDITDEDGLCRARVSLPWLSDGYVTDWSRVVHPGAGPERGSVLLPEVADEVLVAFEHGDPRRAYVLGGLYNGQDRPPLDSGAVDPGSGESGRRGLVSRLGHRVVLDDGTKAPGILLRTGGEGVEIVLDDSTSTVSVVAQGDVQVRGKRVAVSGRSVVLEGEAEVAIKGPNVSVEADGTLTLRGGLVRIN